MLLALEVCRADAQTLKAAADSAIKDFEDAVQHESAVSENLDAIITRNIGDYAAASIKVYSPTDFLKSIK